jgi:hypothetical protein
VGKGMRGKDMERKVNHVEREMKRERGRRRER